MPDEEVESEEEPKTCIDVTAILKSAPKSKVPADIKPMKATRVDESLLVFRIEWDSYRTIANISKDEVSLIRNNLSFDKYYPINEGLKKRGINAVLDRELLVLNDKVYLIWRHAELAKRSRR